MELFLQILVFSVIASSVYTLISIGLTLTFSTLEFINFAHGEMATVGAFLFYSTFVVYDLPVILALMITLGACALIGMIIERFTFRPLKDRQEFLPLVLSIGVSILIKAIIILIYGGGTQTYFKENSENVMSQAVHVFGNNLQVTATVGQIVIFFVTIFLVGATYFFLQKTKTGKAIRAVADDKQVAAVMGVNVDRTLTIVFALGTLLAGIAGILIGFDKNLTPNMGLMLSVFAFASIILGGVGKFKGAIVGAIIIGFLENLGVHLLGIGSNYKELLIFTVFILILIFRPYGIFGGKKEEVESRV